MICGSVVFGLITGLVLMPILLSWFGPDYLPMHNTVEGSVDAGEQRDKEQEASAAGEESAVGKEEIEMEAISASDVAAPPAPTSNV